MNRLLLVLVLFAMIACGKKQQNDTKVTSLPEDPNAALYDELMEMHDQVMLRSDELYKLKQELLKDIASHPDKKQKVDSVVVKLDSASNAMMDWMHHFAMPDSADAEGKRVYLENEMEKMKKIRDMTDESLGLARPLLEKK
ncbi:MAG: hypothetical protein JST14_13475 [Bacteroidetes bacterium]|nr:hypothetical protein [Bacteroidota bacterium]